MKKLKIILIGIFCVMFASAKAQDTLRAPESVGIDSLKKYKIQIYPGFGVSLVRNDLAPVFYINLGLNFRDRYEMNVNTSSFFFFDKGNDNKYNIYRNTFLNAEFLLNFSMFNKKERDFNGLGVGYLIEDRGTYFGEATVMIYYKKKFKFFSVQPGIILENDFKDVFPVISIRL